MIVLGAVLEEVGGEPLDQLAKHLVFEPLGMRDTTFNPGPELRDRIAPTGYDEWRGRFLQGEVHDRNAYVMGGVAGHAGLFSTAEDLSRFARMMLNEGRIDGRQFVSPETVRKFTTRVDIPGSTRALGWDTPGSDPYLGEGWSASSYGHTGRTGTFMWIDPEKDLYVIILTNATYPDGDTSGFGEMRKRICEEILRTWKAPE